MVDKWVQVNAKKPTGERKVLFKKWSEGSPLFFFIETVGEYTKATEEVFFFFFFFFF